VAGEIHAQAFFRGDAKEGLGVDSAAQVVVQIRALRHAHEEGAEFEGIRASGVESARGALFESCSLRGGAIGGGLRVNVRRAK
jgi:hypothetical protein